jgi:hypothetical protein
MAPEAYQKRGKRDNSSSWECNYQIIFGANLGEKVILTLCDIALVNDRLNSYFKKKKKKKRHLKYVWKLKFSNLFVNKTLHTIIKIGYVSHTSLLNRKSKHPIKTQPIACISNKHKSHNHKHEINRFAINARKTQH